MNAVNLPLALFTVILRRFIDKFRTTQGAVILKSTAPWVVDTSLVKSCMYAYMFCTGIYYTMKHMQRGTIVSLARKCSESAATIKDRYVRRGNYHSKNRSSFVKNLVRGRYGQQRALKYIASMSSAEISRTSNPNVMTYNNDENMEPSLQNFEEEMRHYTSNPYFEPSSVPKNNIQSRNYHKPKHNVRVPLPMIEGASDSKPENIVKIDVIQSKEMTPVNVETITISDDVQSNSANALSKPKKRLKPRNCLTLRGRKILKNDFSFCGDSVVRKTRSGKIYGYHVGGPQYVYKSNRKML